MRINIPKPDILNANLKRLVLVSVVGVLLLGTLSGRLNAQSGQTLPPPHLGYGTHIGPHLEAPAAMLHELGMDWVKIYDAGQIPSYAEFRVLFRMDLDWPNDWDYFRDDVTRRTRELVALGADAIEVHNEPNLSLEWPRGPNAWEYVQVLRVAYEMIKAVDPEMIVVSGGLAPTITTPDRAAISDLDFAREMLENGAANYFDAFGYHPYGFNQPPESDPYQHELTFRRVERIRQLLVRYGAGNKPVWLTEFGWLRDPAEHNFECANDPAFTGFQWFVFPVEVQADYTVRAFDYADRNWAWAGPMFLWNLNWQMYDYDYEDQCSHLRWFGMLEPDGTPTVTYHAVAAMPRRYVVYRPQIATRLLLNPDIDTGSYYGEDPDANEENLSTIPIAAYCPDIIRIGEFEIRNAGWPGELVMDVEPINIPNAGLPLTYVSTEQARFGDRVTVYVDVSDTAPGDYMIVVNLRSQFEGRPISGHARLMLRVENSPINCQ